MAYTSFGTRKALGKRYSVDPAILLEAQRLEQEYNLAPGREARGIQASQFASSQGQQASQFSQNLQLQEDARKGAEQGGMIQSGAGMLTNAAMLRAITMEKGAPFFGETATKYGGKAVDAITNLYKPTPPNVPTSPTSPYSTAPAMVDTAAAGAAIAGSGYGTAAAGGLEGISGVAATGAIQGSGYGGAGLASGYTAGASSGAAAAGSSTAGLGLSGVSGAAAGAGVGSFIGSQFGPPKSAEKKAATIGGGIVGGAITGAALTSWSGPGAIVGGIVGAVVGGVAAIFDSWICTEIDKVDPISEDDNKSLSKLRRYAIKNHKVDARAYIKNGYMLIQNSTLDLDYLKKDLVERCCELVRENKMEEAFNHYKAVVERLCDENGFDVRNLYQEVQ
jgi:hypothetical protein